MRLPWRHSGSNMPANAGHMRSIHPWSGTAPRASEQLSPCDIATEANAP